MNILYVHHVRNFDLHQIYSSDSYRTANSQLYGAQELDTWAGIRLLSTFTNVEQFEISPNLESSRHINLRTGEQSLVRWSEKGTCTDTFANKLSALIKNGIDPSVAFWEKPKLINHFLEVLNSKRFDLIWFDTQFYIPLFKYVVTPPLIIRSVNFEPRHVLAEDASTLKYFKTITKTLTEFRASHFGHIVSISHRDKRDYSKFGIRTTLIPLRQLTFLLECSFTQESEPNSIYFSGSSYDVRHNRRNLLFILNKISPILQKEFPDITIKLSGNRFPLDLNIPENVLPTGFIADLQERALGAISVLIPYSGGAGMQSKVFEPLTIGAKVIANPKAMAGYPFLPGVHYSGASSPKQFVEAISTNLKNHENASRKAKESRSLAAELFSRSSMLESLQRLVELAI